MCGLANRDGQTTDEDHSLICDFIGMTKRLVGSSNIDSMMHPAQTPVED